ncbi:MAG: hypothetical protein WC606_00175 [Candidatus Absconditabacterales bacterium]|jgi:hypothetical protein
MQESKEIGPHVTTKEELDRLYKNRETTEIENKEKDILLKNQEK